MDIRLYSSYLPQDRLAAIINGNPLPEHTQGVVLFVDISGFTTLTERLHRLLGARRGAEVLTNYLNQIYTALITPIDAWGGSIINFAGDALVAWFEGNVAQRAKEVVQCAFVLQDTIVAQDALTLSDNTQFQVAIKIAIASGGVQRLQVGDRAIHYLEILVGALMARMAEGEQVAEAGEIILDNATVEATQYPVETWRIGASGSRYAVATRPSILISPPATSASSDMTQSTLIPQQMQAWLLPAVYAKLQSDGADFFTELRPAVIQFVRFIGLDFDGDPNAAAKLDEFVRKVQKISARYGGNLLQLTTGDKGSYFYVVFGAPLSYEDTAKRALHAALELITLPDQLGYLEPLQIGITQGIVRSGSYGSALRRTYGALGDEVNLAARLMQNALPGSILVSARIQQAVGKAFLFGSPGMLKVKGKQEPIEVYPLLGENSSAPQFFSPLLGRQTELNNLLYHCQPIFRGHHAGILYIYGEPGAGKSRLAYELQRSLPTPHRWLTAQADAIEALPLSAFAYVLRRYFNQSREQSLSANHEQFERLYNELLAFMERSENPLIDDLTTYRPFIAGLVGLGQFYPAYSTLEERIQITLTSTTIKTFIQALAVQTPLILHIEDAQWLDLSSLQVIQSLTQKMEQVPLALVITSRPLKDGQLFEVGKTGVVPTFNLRLNRLPQTAVRELAETILGGTITETLADFIETQAEGNPFFVEQITLDVQERGILQQTEQGWDILPAMVEDVPFSISQVLIARLDRLTFQVKMIVQQASILGREFDVRVLSEMLRADPQDSMQAAEQAAIWSSLDRLRYFFRHVLLRDAAYQMQADERRRELHRLAATTIETLYPGDESFDYVLLEHWRVVGDLSKIVQYAYVVATDWIGLSSEYAKAEALLTPLLDQLTSDSPLRCPILIAYAHLFWRTNRYAEGIAYGLEAVELAQRYDDQVNLGHAYFYLGVIERLRGNLEASRTYQTQSLALRNQLNDRSGMATNYTYLGNYENDQGNYPQAETYYWQALSIYQDIGNRLSEGNCWHVLGIVKLYQGQIEEALEYLQDGLIIRRSFGYKLGIALSLIELGNLLADQKNTETSQRYLQEALGICRELGELYALAGCLNTLGSVAYNEQDYQTAVNYFTESVATRRITQDQFLYMDLTWLARPQIQLGNLASARQNLYEALAFVKPKQGLRSKLWVLYGIAELLIAESKWEHAAELVCLEITHPANEIAIQEMAKTLYEHLRSKLLPQALEAALIRGQNIEISTRIETLLATWGDV